MEKLSLNGLPVPLPDLKDMDDCIIKDMNFRISHKEIVIQWATKIRKKLIRLAVYKNEKVCEDTLKDYIRLLNDQAKHFKEKKILKEKILSHLKLFHLLCGTSRERVGLYLVNYLDYIEMILIFVCNLELEIIKQLKRNRMYTNTVKTVARSIINNLSINLMFEEKRIFHVILKLDPKHEQSCKDAMHYIYQHYLLHLPVRDRSDLSFCRYYLLFQKWKTIITEKEKYIAMDNIIYFTFRTTHNPDCLKTNPLLKSILSPPSDSLVDLMDVLTNSQQVKIKAYFKYIEGRYDDDEEIHIPEAIDLDSDDDDCIITQKTLFEPSESEKRRNGLIKSEKHKPPVHENTKYVEVSSNDGQVVCLIDDDSDIEEVCVVDDRSSCTQKLGHKPAASRPVVRFLDSICVPDDCISSSAEESTLIERVCPPTPPAETIILPIVTAYIDAARRKVALTEIDTLETSSGIEESLRIRFDEQKNVANLTEVLNTVSCSENIENPEHYNNNNNNEIVPSDHSHSKNNTVQQDTCAQSELSSQNSEHNVEVENVNQNKKCPCCRFCKHTTNVNNQVESEINTNKSVIKPNLKTVEEIQIENMESYDYLCGMITPPSDRTTDENSPSSIENMCSESEIYNNNRLHSGNTNVYAYVPIITATEESDVENNSSVHNHYESEVETTPIYSGICDSSTHFYSFDLHEDPQNQNEENSRDIQQEPIEFTESNQEEETTPIVEPMNETELPEETQNITEPEKQNENTFIEAEPEVQANNNEPSQMEEEQRMEQEFEEQANYYKSKFDETGLDNDFNETCLEQDSEVVIASELEVNDNLHVEETELVSEIDLHEEDLSEALPEIVGSAENVTATENEENQERFELEPCKDNTFETINNQEVVNLIPTTSKEYQIEENYASNEPETIMNNISPYSNLTEVPIIIAESQNTNLQEPAIGIIPLDLINTVILGENYAKEIPQEKLIVNTEDNNGSETSIYTKEVSYEKESLQDFNAIEAEQSCKVQASVTMAQLVNSKTSKNRKYAKKSKKKNVEDNNGDKIIYTSNERVKSAPLSLFAKFEQSQSDLVENAFSGPIEPINGRTNISCDNSNSNDSFCMFDSDKCVITKYFTDNNSPSIIPEADSPISPPYENIHAQEYENHMLNVNLESFTKNVPSIEENNKIISSKNVTTISGDQQEQIIPSVRKKLIKKQKQKSLDFMEIFHHKEEKSFNPDEYLQIPQYKKLKHREENKLNSDTFELSSASNSRSRKKKLNDGIGLNKKVQFGPDEIRLFSDGEFEEFEEFEALNATIQKQTMLENNVGCKDPKLFDLRPHCIIESDVQERVKIKMREMELPLETIRSNLIIQNLMLEKKSKAENSCILKRVDYKKQIEDNLPKNRIYESPYSPTYWSSAGPSAVPSAISKRVDTPTRVSDYPPPPGYIPALNSHKPANPLRHSIVQLVQNSSSNTSLHNQINTSNCRHISNEQFNRCLDQCNTGILDLSLKASSPSISLPESEFSRSPKFLPNPDRIVQQCLLETNEADSVITIDKKEQLFSNNSNFYKNAADHLKFKLQEDLGCAPAEPKTNEADPVIPINNGRSFYSDNSNLNTIDYLKSKSQEDLGCVPAEPKTNEADPVIPINNGRSFYSDNSNLNTIDYLKSKSQEDLGCVPAEPKTNEADPVIPINNGRSFYSDNSNLNTIDYLKSKSQEDLGCVPAEPTTNLDEEPFKNESVDNIIEEKNKPLKKRKIGNDKLSAKCETITTPVKEEIGYPAKRMFSIAEFELLPGNQNFNKSIKTPAERKEMPPILYSNNSTDPSPIITDHLNINNHTYHNPTFNVHMTNVPMAMPMPCQPYSLPPFVYLHHPFGTTNVSQNIAAYNNEVLQDHMNKTTIKKETRKRSRKATHNNYYPDYKGYAQ